MKASQVAKEKRSNIITIAMILFVIGLILFLRFFQLGIFKTSHRVDLMAYYQEDRANHELINRASRGTIYDSKGYPLAIDTQTYSMYAILDSTWTDDVVEDPETTAMILSNYIDLSRKEILDLLTLPDASQVEFGEAGRNLSPETQAAIEAENIPGIVTVSSTSRKYVNDWYASHLIGYAKPKNEPASDLEATILEGELGIEYAYDDYLSGETRYKPGSHEMQGQDIYLTLDSRLQNYMEELLERHYQVYRPLSIGSYVVEVKTGRLLATGQRPSFNLNTREGIEAQWNNLLVGEANEPGSTVKILTTAVAKDLGLYRSDELFQSGSVDVYDRVISDYNLEGWGQIGFDEGLARSSNTAMVELVNRIGLERWQEYLEGFGFGQLTDSNLPGEVSGNLDFDNPISITMSSFGQGFSATVLQLLEAFTSIANDGKMMEIQYIDHFESQDSNAFQPRVKGQLVSAEASDHVLSVMVDTVNEEYGTARAFAREDVQVAAKTGTAEIASPDGSGYLTGPTDYYFSVVAFLPAEDPEYMIYLFMKQPETTKGRLGSDVLSDLFHPLVHHLLISQ